jgi:iron complex transport system substrate-binding protein
LPRVLFRFAGAQQLDLAAAYAQPLKGRTQVRFGRIDNLFGAVRYEAASARLAATPQPAWASRSDKSGALMPNQRRASPCWRRRAVLTALLILAGASGACTPGATPSPPIATAQRIVSLAPSATEVLFEAGCEGRVVGVTSYCRYPAQATTLPKVGGYLAPSYEALVALRPDMVVILPEHVDARRYLTTLGLDIAEFDHRTIRGIIDSIGTAGDLCGTRPRADAAVSQLEDQLRRVDARTAGRPRPRVVISVSRSQERGFGSLSAAGPDGVYHDLLLRAGGQNAVPPGPVLHPALSAESLLRLNPDAIVEFAPGAGDGTAIREEWRALPSLTAVARRRVFVFTEDFLPVPGPRLVRFTETLARALHPAAPHARRPE